MRKIATYTLIFLMLQFNVALAECEWQLVEETPTYVREQCKAGTGMGARIRTKTSTAKLVSSKWWAKKQVH